MGDRRVFSVCCTPNGFSSMFPRHRSDAERPGKFVLRKGSRVPRVFRNTRLTKKQKQRQQQQQQKRHTRKGRGNPRDPFGKTGRRPLEVRTMSSMEQTRSIKSEYRVGETLVVRERLKDCVGQGLSQYVGVHLLTTVDTQNGP